MKTEQELHDFCTAKSRVYQYDAEYANAAHKLLLLKNPVGNFYAARQEFIAPYLLIRRSSSSPLFKSQTRTSALLHLSAIRAEYRALGLFPSKVKG
jgi:hypothetical protein